MPDTPDTDTDTVHVDAVTDAQNWQATTARLAAMVRTLARENAALRRAVAEHAGGLFTGTEPEVVTVTAGGRHTAFLAFVDRTGTRQLVEVAL